MYAILKTQYYLSLQAYYYDIIFEKKEEYYEKVNWNVVCVMFLDFWSDL